MRIALLAALWLITAPAAAQQQWTVEKVFPVAISWIERNSTYKNIPPVKYWMELSQDEISARLTREGSAHVYAEALYECSSQTLILRKDMKPGNIATWGIIIHELTHHAQCVNGKMGGERCALEREAYSLQAEYYRQTAAAPANAANAKEIAAKGEQFAKIADDVCDRLKQR
jgi:hypothetical protein